MENINIEIPGELITAGDSEINFELLKNKTIIGFCGYARSGKDTIGNLMVDRLGFKRISFGDVLKKDLDEHMRPQVYNDLVNKGASINLEDVRFLAPQSVEIKEMLRPYMIWFGETMKTTNGIHHWTNRALQEIGDSNKIVITDVRRINELELFRYNKEQYKRKLEHMFLAELPTVNFELNSPNDINEDFASLLIHINQFKLSDGDSRTIDTIVKANENWLFDYVVNIDSRIPDREEYRKTYMYNHLLALVSKFPKYFV